METTQVWPEMGREVPESREGSHDKGTLDEHLEAFRVTHISENIRKPGFVGRGTGRLAWKGEEEKRRSEH